MSIDLAFSKEPSKESPLPSKEPLKSDASGLSSSFLGRSKNLEDGIAPYLLQSQGQKQSFPLHDPSS